MQQFFTRLPTIHVTKRFAFELSHALPSHNGACKNIHGHSYKLEVTVSGKPQRNPESPADGMVMDFAQLKAIVQEHIIDVYDHALVLGEHDRIRFPSIEEATRVIYVPFSPTCEMLLIHFCNSIAHHLPPDVKLCNVKLEETATSCAEWWSTENL
jgi:6-pyruvoyltetrahydropterin/6-carboxytetrahydropterin synthase